MLILPFRNLTASTVKLSTTTAQEKEDATTQGTENPKKSQDQTEKGHKTK